MWKKCGKCGTDLFYCYRRRPPAAILSRKIDLDGNSGDRLLNSKGGQAVAFAVSVADCAGKKKGDRLLYIKGSLPPFLSRCA